MGIHTERRTGARGAINHLKGTYIFFILNKNANKLGAVPDLKSKSRKITLKWFGTVFGLVFKCLVDLLRSYLCE